MDNIELEFDDQLRHAARSALNALGMEGAKIRGVINHLSSTASNPDRWSIRFLDTNGKYLDIVFDELDVMERRGSLDMDVLIEEIIRLLQERDPNSYLEK